MLLKQYSDKAHSGHIYKEMLKEVSHMADRNSAGPMGGADRHVSDLSPRVSFGQAEEELHHQKGHMTLKTSRVREAFA